MGSGISAPELVTAVVAALRGEPDGAVGNVGGSDACNVLGAACAVSPQTLARETMVFDLPVMVVASVALWPIVVTRSRISRLEGAALVAGYAAYVVFVLRRGV